MKTIVIRYLDKNYYVPLSTVSYTLIDRFNREPVGIKTLFASLQLIFNITEEDTLSIYNEWIDKQFNDYYVK